MTEQNACQYPGDRTDALLTYLYSEDDAGRSAFAAHLSGCADCRAELDALQGVRVRLSDWAPPEPAGALGWLGGMPPRAEPARVVRGPWRALAGIPVWAQVAAASLLVGVSVGIANVQVQYADGGFTIRTGWRAMPAAAANLEPAANTEAAPWRAEIAALRTELQSGLAEARAVPVAAAPQAAAVAPEAQQAQEALMRQVRALIDESDRRHQRELALRVGEAMRDVSAQRRADLVSIDRSIGTMQNNMGIEMLKQREQLNNYVLRVSSQK